DRLLILVHHLVLDAASFQLFLADLWTAYQQRLAGQPTDLPPPTASLTEWTAALDCYLKAPERAQEIELWVDQPWSEAAEIPLDEVLGPNIKSSARKLRIELDEPSSRALLSELPRRHGLDTRDLLLAGPLGALVEWTGCDHQVVYLLDHGRGPFPGSVDVSRTVGWFATSYPVLLAWPGGGPWQGAVAIAEQRKAVPHRGFGYGVLRYF
ncbi:MAG: hypothetical protein GY838_15725, partial [bacterium]|nr:hypothetical protein [bacterium]